VHCGEKAGFLGRMHARCEDPWRRRVLGLYGWSVLHPVSLARTDCLTCGHPRLQQQVVLSCRGIPHDRPGHELVYHHEVLARCSECRRGQLEKLDHDCFDFFESWDLYGWFVLDESDMDRLHQVLARPPAQGSEGIEADLAASARGLRLADWSGGAVLPRYADRDAIHNHVASVRLRWEGNTPSFVAEDAVP
jgi:hypothetical protein